MIPGRTLPPTRPETVHPPWKIELRALLKLALPVITIQVGMMLMGFVDTMMVGRYAEEHLAAAALGNFYGFIAIMFGIGLLHSLDPLLSQAVGAGDHDSITRNLQRGIVLAAILTVPTSVVFMLCEPVFLALGQDAKLVPLAGTYVWTLIPSILPFVLFQILRSTLQAYHQTAAIVWTILIANVFNAVVNWVLIFGHLGFEPMGLAGSAIATLLSRWLMFGVLVWIGWKRVGPHVRAWTRSAIELEPLLRIVKVGAPIGLQMMLEFGAFGMTLLLMGWISVSALAGHQAAINLASLTYMFPLGLSFATSVRVGHGVGRGDAEGARWSAMMALYVGAMIMGIFAVVFVLFPEPLAGLFTKDDDDGARHIAMALLPIAAVFQIVDGLQVVSLGALRGVADTKMPALINLIGFWGFGIPTGYWLAFEQGLGPEGLWWGLTVGLTAVAGFLLLRVWFKLRGELTRTVVDS